jgi:hypothetical protein
VLIELVLHGRDDQVRFESRDPALGGVTNQALPN